MNTFRRLVQNENMKLYTRKSTWIMLALLVVVIFIVGWVTQFLVLPNEDKDWRALLQAETVQLKMELSEQSMPEAMRKQYTADIAINEYRLAQEISPVGTKSFWGFVEASTSLISLASLFTIVIAGGMVAGEFTWGTIKLLLIRPVSRTSILFSKFTAVLLFALGTLALLLVSSLAAGGAVYGLDGAATPHLAYVNGEVVEKGMLGHVLTMYALHSVDLLMMASLAFMISTVFHSSALAIGISIFLMFTGSQFVLLLSNYDWVKYVLFANTNLSQYVDGMPPISGMTMTFSVIVLAVYFAIFHGISWLVFNKRDVAM